MRDLSYKKTKEENNLQTLVINCNLKKIWAHVMGAKETYFSGKQLKTVDD